MNDQAKEEALFKVFKVQGMDCPDEAELIEKKLNGLKGIKDFRIDLLGQKVKLDYDPTLTSVQEIVRTIAETGMKVWTEKEKEGTKPWWQELKMVFLFSCGLIALMAYSLQLLGFSEIAVKTFYGVAIVTGGYYPARIGLAAVRTLTLNINTLLVVAALGAVTLNLWEEAAILVFVYSLGAVLETYAVDRARGSIRALMELAPKVALVRKDGREMVLPVEEVVVGDIIIVRPGERIPLDGWVSAGSSTVDQSPITGESIPVNKGKGDEVYAGTINQRGSLEVAVSKLSKDSTVVRIIHQVEEAQGRKSSYQRFGEKFGKYYTPAMFLLALLVSVVPPIFFGQPFSPWFYRGLVLLVVSCSCGLALSVPVAVVAAITSAARHGVLIKGGAYLEAASGLKVLAFDKTGTLTTGRPRVTDIIAANGVSETKVLALAAAIESRSEHPLAEAILRRAREEGVEIPSVEDFEALPGIGAKAKVDGKLYHVGSSRLVHSEQFVGEELLRLQAQGKTVILLGREEKPLGIIAVADQLRQGVGEVIKSLKDVGIGRIVMLTGDNEGTARAVSAEAGVDEYWAQLLPEEKVRTIEELGRQYGKVAMVGDGVNDAPAMAAADVGIAMGAAGTDVALETGDLALMSDDLSKLPYAVNLSQRSVKNIQQNIAASLAIVAFLIPAALAGWIGLVRGLLLNEISALMVIGNGLRLLRLKDGQ